MENEGDCPTESVETSLMNSLKVLNGRAEHLRDISNLSYELLEKLTNPFPFPSPIPEGDKTECQNNDTPVLSLVELFNKAIEDIQRSTI